MSDATRTVGEVIDDIPVGRFHRRLLAVTGLVWGVAALEILVISFTMPVFSEIWDLTAFQTGVLGSATLFGMMVGNPIGGWYGDRVGRKTAVSFAVAFFSVSSGLMALAGGFYSALLLRVLTGLGVGGMVASGASYLTEHVPTDRRGRYLAYLEVFFAVGSVVTVVLAAAIMPTGVTDGTVFGVAAWRVFYVVAAVPILFVVVFRYEVEESPYYLASVGRVEEAGRRLRAIAETNDADVNVADAAIETTEDAETGFRVLFRPDVLGTTVLTSALWFGLNFGYYGVVIWLPDTVQAAGYVGGLYRYLFVVSVFQVLGVVAASTLVDRIGRRTTLAVAFTLGGLSTALFTVAIPGVDVGLGVGGRLPFLAGLFASGFFIFGVFGTIFVYTTELFPTEVRSTGLGFAGSVGKIAAVVGPVLVGGLVEYGYHVALAPFAVALVAAGVLVAVFGRETMGEALR